MKKVKRRWKTTFILDKTTFIFSRSAGIFLIRLKPAVKTLFLQGGDSPQIRAPTKTDFRDLKEELSLMKTQYTG